MAFLLSSANDNPLLSANKLFPATRLPCYEGLSLSPPFVAATYVRFGSVEMRSDQSSAENRIGSASNFFYEFSSASAESTITCHCIRKTNFVLRYFQLNGHTVFCVLRYLKLKRRTIVVFYVIRNKNDVQLYISGYLEVKRCTTFAFIVFLEFITRKKF